MTTETPGIKPQPNAQDAARARFGSVFSLVLLLCFLGVAAAAAQNPGWQWAKKATGAGNSGSGMAVDAEGNIYSTGSFSGSVTFDTITLSSSNIGLFIAKHDSAGNVLWAKRVAQTQGGASNGIAVDANGFIYLAGSYTNGTVFGAGFLLTNQGVYDAFVAKFSPIGNLVWVRRGGGNSLDQANAIVLNEQAEIVITGTFEGAANFGNTTLASAGGSDIFVAKYNTSGGVVWANRAGGTDHDFSLKICTGSNNGYFICGQFRGAASFGGATVSSQGGLDGFVAKVNAAGSFAWAVPIGGVEEDAAVCVKADSQGNALVAGRFFGQANFGGASLTASGNYDAFLASYADAGALNWAKQIGGPHYETAAGICLDAQNRITLAGSYHTQTTIGSQTLAGIGAEDLFVAGFTPTGNAVWATNAGGIANDYPADLVLDAASNCYLSGICFGPSEFGSIALAGAGIGSFIARLNSQVLAAPHTQELLSQLVVFPNPAAGSVFVSVPVWLTQPLTLRVFSATAQLVHSQVLLPVAGQQYVRISLPAEQQKGLYFLQFSCGSVSKTVRLTAQ